MDSIVIDFEEVQPIINGIRIEAYTREKSND